MKVYSLIGFVEYEGESLIGVFGSVEDVLKCGESKEGKWYYHDIGYVEHELGESELDILGRIEYLEFNGL